MLREDFDPSGAGRVFETGDVFQAAAEPGNENTVRATHSPQTPLRQPELNQLVSPLFKINELRRSLQQNQLRTHKEHRRVS